MAKKFRRAFYLDGDTVVAETDVVRFAVGHDDQSLRSQVWTFFGSAERQDFYVTSSLISSDQKGSIHPTRAQFGYTSQGWPPSHKTWVGSYPASRHLETLLIPPLAERDHFHVMTLRLPGVGLRKVGRPARKPKPLVLIQPFDPDIIVTLNLVLYEGDWREFIAPLPGQKAIAALRNPEGRSLIIFLRKERQQDGTTFYDDFLRSLPLPAKEGPETDDMTLFATHQRQSDEPILITELHNVIRTNPPPRV